MKRARVKHNYVATDDGELTVKQGELLTVLEEDDETGWWKARNAAGLVGYAPSNFLEPEPEVVDPPLVPAKPRTGSVPILPVKLEEGPLKLYRGDQWLALHAVVKDKVLALRDADDQEVASSSVMMPVRRGAPADVEPPPGEENCQFRLGELLLSAPSFDACAEWMSGLKRYNKRVSEARKSVELKKDVVSKIDTQSASPTSASSPVTPGPLSPQKKAATLRGSSSSGNLGSPTTKRRLGTLRSKEDGGRASRSSQTLRGTSRGGDDEKAKSRSSGTLRGSARDDDVNNSPRLGSALNDLSKKASDLLFRRKERDARKEKRKQAAIVPDLAKDDSDSAWPEVGRVVVQPTSPKSPSAAASSPSSTQTQVQKATAAAKTPASADTTEFAAAEVAVEVEEFGNALPEDDMGSTTQVEFDASNATDFQETEDDELRAAEDLVAQMEVEMAEARETEIAMEEAAQQQLEMSNELEEIRRLAKEEMIRQRIASEEQRRKLEEERALERKRGEGQQKQLQKQIADLRAQLKEAQQWSALAESLKAELATEQETSTSLRQELSAAQDGAKTHSSAELEQAQALLRQARSEIQMLQNEATSTSEELARVGNEKDQALLDLQLKDEAFARQKATLQMLMEEKAVSRKTMAELRAQLEEQLQDVFSESMRADDTEAKLAQVEEEKQHVEARLEAKIKEVSSITAVCEEQRQRINALESKTDADNVRLTQLKTELEATRDMLRTNTMELEELRASMNEKEAQNKINMEAKEAELAQTKETAQKEIEKLKRSVEAVASGRGRLEQQAEMQARLDKAEETLEEERARLEGQIASLQEENELLAESNEQLMAALEAEGATDALAGLNSKLDLQDWEARCKEIEAELTAKMVDLEKAAKEKDGLITRVTAALKQLKGDLEASESDNKDKSERIKVLDDRLAALKKEFELLQSVLDTTKESSAALRVEFDAKATAASNAIKEFRTKLDEERAKVASLEEKLKEAEEAKREMDRTIADQEAEKEETGSEMKSIRERLNEAIQERWLVEEKVKKMENEMERREKIPGLGLTPAEIDAKERDLNRRIQDLEGQVKRGKLESQEYRLKAGGQIRTLQEEREKTEEALKLLTKQVVELEDDLAVAEETNREYEQLLKLAIQESKKE